MEGGSAYAGGGADPVQGRVMPLNSGGVPVAQQGAPTFFLWKKKVGKEKPRLQRRRGPAGTPVEDVEGG